MTEFIQMWQPYQIAIDNDNCGRQINIIGAGTYITVNIDELENLKRATMLEY